MNKIINSLMLDVNKNGLQHTVWGIRSGDTNTRALEIELVAGGRRWVPPDDCIATVFALLPNGQTVYRSADILCGGLISFILSEEASIPGLTKCEVRVTADDAVLTSPCFGVYVEGVLQNDSAIEAQSSFSALTDALGRVLEAENGLSSKVDKVEGTPGNLVVFGEGGTIADGGKIPEGGGGNPSYYLVYDDTGASDEENKVSIKAILEAVSAGKHFAVFIKDYETVAPAQLEVLSNGCEISYKDDGYKSIIKYYKSSDRIAYNSEVLYSSSFSETGLIPATQKATATWVKSYVDSALLIDTEVIL